MSDGRRLFAALPAARPALYEGAMALAERLPGAWHPLANYHITLAFIGLWPGDAAPVIQALARAARRAGPVQVSTGERAGFFKEGPRGIAYAPVAPEGGLTALALRVREELEASGIPFGKEPFIPHITLARKVDTRQADSAQALLPPCRWVAGAFCLYESLSTPAGVRYRPLETFETEKYWKLSR